MGFGFVGTCAATTHTANADFDGICTLSDGEGTKIQHGILDNECEGGLPLPRDGLGGNNDGGAQICPRSVVFYSVLLRGVPRPPTA